MSYRFVAPIVALGFVFVFVLVAASCAPAPTPSPTADSSQAQKAEPAKPAAAPAAPAAADSSQAQKAASPAAAPAAAAAAKPDAKPVTREKIVLAQAVDSLVFLPTYVALAKGFWAEEGLDVDFQIVKGGPVSVTALIAGQAQVIANSADTPLLAKKAGGNTLIISNLLDKAAGEIVIHKQVLEKNNISPEQWEKMSYADRSKVYKGIRWGIIGPGGLTDLLVRAVIKSGGFDPEREASIQPIGGSPEIYAAMRSGQIDAMVQAPPTPHQAVADGFAVFAGNLHQTSDKFAEFSYEVLVVESNWAKNNPETVRKIGRGIAKANDYSRNTDAAQVAKDVQSYFPKIEPNILVQSVKSVQPTVPLGGIITKKSMDNMVEFYVAGGSVKKEEVPSTDEGVFWTNEYLPKR